MSALTIARVWFDVVSLDCDRCTSTDGAVRLAYDCADCATYHTATVCPACGHVDPGTSHAVPGLRTLLREAALRSLEEARP